MVGHQVLVLGIGVRSPVPEPRKNTDLVGVFTCRVINHLSSVNFTRLFKLRVVGVHVAPPTKSPDHNRYPDILPTC